MCVLIVDGGTELSLCAKEYLAAEGGLEVSLALCGQETLAVLGLAPPSSSGGEIDAVVVDAALPGKEALDLCRRIRDDERTCDLPVIFLGDAEGELDRRAAFTAGASDFHVRPPRLPDLLFSVHAAISWKRRLDRHKLRERELLERNEQLERSNLALQSLTHLDPLTGIANRRYFEDRFTQEWWRLMRLASPLSVVMIDVDLFKAFNDHYGHQRGDECLTRVANALRCALRRPGDVVARYGGEEFVALLPHTSVEGALAVAAALRDHVEEMAIEHEESPARRVTISLGAAAEIPVRYRQPAELLAGADRALYQAKREGRNRVQFLNDPRRDTFSLELAGRE